MKVVVTVDGAAVGFFVRLASAAAREWASALSKVGAAAVVAEEERRIASVLLLLLLQIASVLLGRFARKPAMDIWALSHLGRFRDAALIRRVMNTRIVAAVKALVVAAGK